MSHSSRHSHQIASPRHIAFEGPLGSGKTMLATMLANQIGARLLLESFEDNPFLGDFYRNRTRYAFQTQMFFLLSRFSQQQQFAQLDLFHESIVTDYIFDKDKIFASLTLNEHELKLYEMVAATMSESVARPDLVVYLQCSLTRLVSNIRTRSRAIEKPITAGYLRDLSAAYSHYFTHYTATPILVVDTANMDFVGNPQLFEELVEAILAPSSEQRRVFQRSRGEIEEIARTNKPGIPGLDSLGKIFPPAEETA